jgi:rhamnose utilization protein RhaD (predicted bifunctional aldolase and dehydrogenase)
MSEKYHNELLSNLVELSRFYGSRPEFVLYGGGNTSVKTNASLFIKASGIALKSIDMSGLVEMNRSALRKILSKTYNESPFRREQEIKRDLLAARVHPEKEKRPSVETIMHELFVGRYVVHLHPTCINMIACSTNGKSITQEIFGENIVWVNYVDPGYTLAKLIEKTLAAFKKDRRRVCPDALIMQNHGLLVGANEPHKVREIIDNLVETATERVGRFIKEDVPSSHLDYKDRRKWIDLLKSILPSFMSRENRDKRVVFDGSSFVLRLVNNPQGQQLVEGGPLTPDQIVYCKQFPLWVNTTPGENSDSIRSRLERYVARYRQIYKHDPKVVIVQGVGLFGIDTTDKTASIVRDVYIDSIKIMFGAKQLGGIRYLTSQEREFIDTWEVEQYRRKAAME